MFKSLSQDFQELKRGQPGSRFRDFRRYKRQQRAGKKPILRIITFAIGLLLVLGGLAIGWLPGPGGFVALIGLALLAREIPWIARLLDFGEIVTRKTWRWFRRFPFWLQVVTTGLAAVICAASIWLGVRYLF